MDSPSLNLDMSTDAKPTLVAQLDACPTGGHEAASLTPPG